jgi:Flp pilus assembly protein TadG
MPVREIRDNWCGAMCRIWSNNMIGGLKQFRGDKRGVAAVELALILPLLMSLLFGFYETGRYFQHVHVVEKAVRDGVRYAARNSFASFPCPSTTIASALVTNTKNLVRTGRVVTGGTALLPYWTNASTITVSMTCNTSGSYTGIYMNLTGGVPVVQVSVSVPYTSLFGALGPGSSLAINKVAQSAVLGL